ncbi:GNAT family N-acetyltransferase [Noviherbaspirillum denitrificans]|uniref:GNAT family N-acetyltransferase n=1 Tax=Noviherbaspirillum denitrificans TaxID=1968433 RepID=UPI001F289BBF|nr:GNAT family N-acetyltransferase [Noviherbaspirillum denitrificans]
MNTEGLNSPLLDPDFVAPLLEEFTTGKELIACHTQSGKVDAMAVLAPTRRGAWHTLQPSQAPVGLWLQRPGLELDSLLPSLLRKLPGFPVVLGLTQQDPMLLPRPQDSSILRTMDYIETARINLVGTFDEYWSQRGKNLRHNLKKQRSKLENEGISLTMEILRSPADVANALAEYGRLESTGWKGTEGTAVHPDNAQGRFYRKMLEAFCARGLGKIYRYRYNDRVAAMNLCIKGRNSIVVLKTAYDESIKDGSSPAFLLRQDELKQMFQERHFDSLEFYGKVMDWHRKWTDDMRTIYHVNCYRYAFLAQLHHAVKGNRAAPKEVSEATQDA